VPVGVAVCGACLKTPPPFELAIAAVDYDHPWDELVRRFKFDAALDLAGVLAQRLLEAVRHGRAPRPDWLLPVPLAAARLRERGYNQAWELARRVAPKLPCASDARLLLRVKDTPHQLALPPEMRAANVRGAFAVDPRRLHELQGRSVAMIDDVMTTGATATELARMLLNAGARSVQVWVLARTPSPHEL
jgi:ComF family protein